MAFNEIRISAPSKLILHGEHAVVYGKTAVAASLDLRTRMIIRIPRSQELEKNDAGQSILIDSSSDGKAPSPCVIERKRSKSMNCQEMSNMVTVSFPDIGIKESWKLDIIQKELLNKRPKNIYGCDNHCSKCWSTKDFYRQNDGSINEPFLLEICAFLKISKADLRMQSLVCFFYLYSHLCGPEAIPLDISIESDIPIGAGLGSSAALSVCLSAGLLTIQDLKETCVSCNENSSRSHKLNQSEGIGCEKLKLICDFAYLSEKILHGRPSGIDNTASTYGGLIQFQNFKVVLPHKSSNDKNNDKINSPKINILLVNTNVPKNTKMMVQRVANKLRDKPYQVQETMEEIDKLSKSAFDLLTKDLNGEDLSNAIIDDSRINSQWGPLIDRNHYLLAKGLGVSHSKLDAVCDVASRFGLHGKLTGAGGGGYAFIILPSNCPVASKAEIRNELEEMDCSVCETTLGASGGVKINVMESAF